MIKAVFNRSDNGEISGFEVKGHANSSGKGEYDLICASVSAIGYTALGGLQELCGIECYEERNGYLKMDLPGNLSEETMKTAQIILKTMEIGLQQVEAQYTSYIRVIGREV